MRKLLLTSMFGQGGREKCWGLQCWESGIWNASYSKQNNQVIYIKCNNQPESSPCFTGEEWWEQEDIEKIWWTWGIKQPSCSLLLLYNSEEIPAFIPQAGLPGCVCRELLLLAGLLQRCLTSGCCSCPGSPRHSWAPVPCQSSSGWTKDLYFTSSQFLPCLMICSFSGGFPASQPPRSHKASTNQLGSWVYFKHKDVRFFLISWKHRNYCDSQGNERSWQHKVNETKQTSHDLIALPVTSLGAHEEISEEWGQVCNAHLAWSEV